MKTYSQRLNSPTIDVNEAGARAAQNDLCLGRMDAYLDTIRPLYPRTKYATYVLHRYLTQGQIDHPTHGWLKYCTDNGVNPEVAFIHHIIGGSSVRRKDGTGWYVANMGNIQYLQWRRTKTLLTVLGLEFDAVPYTTGPMDACDYDLVLWYPAFDSQPSTPVDQDPNPCILQSVEYAGTGDLYQDQCKDDFIATQLFLDQSGASGVEMYPNFGSVSLARGIDANTIAVVNAASGIIVEVVLRFDNNQSGPNLEIPTDQDAEDIWDFFDAQCNVNDKKVFGHGYTETAHESEAHAKNGTAAFFLMADHENLHGRFVSDISEPNGVAISTWEQNDLMRSASLKIGPPIAAREEVGSWTGGRLYRRVFERGEVFMYIRKWDYPVNSALQVATATPNVAMYPLDDDGMVQGKVASVQLSRAGEAVIFWDGTSMATATLTLTGTGTAEWTPTPGVPDADHYTLVDETLPGDDTNYVTNGGHVNGFIEEFEVDAGPDNNIAKVTNMNLEMLFSGLAVTNLPAFRVEVVVAGLVVGSKEFGADTGGVFEEASINIPMAVLGDIWYAGPRKIRFIPIDGNAGYGGVPHEEG